MSELRDLTAALRAFDKRITGVEECLLLLVRDSQQQSEWRHEQKNSSQKDNLFLTEMSKTLAQLEAFQGSLWNYLATLDGKLVALANTRLEDVKALNKRVGVVEEKVGIEEVTQA